MKMKSVVLGSVALGFGFVAMLGVKQAMSAKNAPTKTKRILVAKQEIIPNVKLEAMHVGFEEFPADKVPQDAITDAVDYDGRASKYSIAPKQPLTKAMLTEKGQFGFSSNIPSGMTSYPLKVNSTQAHGGLVQKGDKINILVTYKAPGDPRPKTKTVMEMITVLDDGRPADGDKSAKGKIENLIVLVKPEQAQRLAQAGAKGELHIALRNPNDKEISNVNMLTDEDFDQLEASVGEEVAEKKVPEHLLKPVAEEPKEPEPAAEPVVETEPVEPPWTITIYEGEQVREVEILPPGSPVSAPEPADATVDTSPGDAPAKGKSPARLPKGPPTEPKKTPKTNTASIKPGH